MDYGCTEAQRLTCKGDDDIGLKEGAVQDEE